MKRVLTLFIMCCAVMGFTRPAFARHGDGTGPEGQGPRTGRSAGYCAGYSVPGHQNTEIPKRGARTNAQNEGKGPVNGGKGQNR